MSTIAEVYVIDTETTGLDGYPVDVIVDIGVSKVNFVKETVEDVYSSMVGYDISTWSEERQHAWIFENTDLTLIDVFNAPRPNTVINDLLPILFGRYVTAFNTGYDLVKFLYHSPWNFNTLFAEVTDIMKAAVPVCKVPRATGVGYKFPKLQEAYDIITAGDPAGINGKQDHRALSDTRVAGHVMLQMFKNGDYVPKVVPRVV